MNDRHTVFNIFMGILIGIAFSMVAFVLPFRESGSDRQLVISSFHSAMCDDSKALVLFNSMKNHPDQWTYDGFNFENKTKDVSVTETEVYNARINFTTSVCLEQIQKVAKPIEMRDEIQQRQDFIRKLK